MAQSGIPGTLYQIDLTKLGELSGPGGLIGAAVFGFQYFPIKDVIDFEAAVPAVIIDKIRVPSNLPNRTNANKVENQTTIIDVYVCVPPDLASTITVISPSIDPVYIPAHLITKIVSLPKIECCDVDDNITTQLLRFVPSALNLGTYNPPYPQDAGLPITIEYNSLTQPVEVSITADNGFSTNWVWKKSNETTYVQIIGNNLYYSLGELAAGGGYLDIDIKFIDFPGAIGGSPSVNPTITITADGDGALLTDDAEVEITITNLIGS